MSEMMSSALLYDYVNVSYPLESLEIVVWGLFIGFVIASLMAVYNKGLIGGFIKALLSNECTSEESAKTISELGYGTDYFVKNALRTNTVLRRFVVRVDYVLPRPEGEEAATDETTPEKPPKVERTRGGHEIIDFETARFYIPEELKYRAEVRYARRGTNVVSLIVTVIILAVAAFGVLYLVPEMVQLLDNFIGTFVS